MECDKCDQVILHSLLESEVDHSAHKRLFDATEAQLPSKTCTDMSDNCPRLARAQAQVGQLVKEYLQHEPSD